MWLRECSIYSISLRIAAERWKQHLRGCTCYVEPARRRAGGGSVEGGLGAEEGGGPGSRSPGLSCPTGVLAVGGGEGPARGHVPF